ncbi:glycosyltransferase family 2 protein [Kutzneria albida]|uniref:glycosyltransferase family 2 protein n=1 Tax=Kutzneria albida TaxID=43357 RepID=UPI0004AA5422|nr:glycosyltransferase family 2 protein [Kutzneria albida]
MAQARTTVVVVTWRGRAHIADCLAALDAQHRAHRVLVVDNASTDGTAELLGGREVLRLNRNAGYAGGVASALPGIDTEFVAWLNDDTAPSPGWLAELEDALDADPGAAAATSALTLPDGSVQSTGVRLTADGHGADTALAGRDVFGFCGGAALVRTDRLRAAGGVPAGFFCYYEDTDTSWRLRLHGWRVISVGPARVVHRHGASSGLGSSLFHRWNERNRLLMLIRCAPLAVAAGQLARFAAITALLPLRRNVPRAANFQLGLRLRVLGEVLLRLPAALAARTRIGLRATLPRRTVWQQWAGR